MSKCCWKITKDHLYGSNKTFVGPKSCRMDRKNIKGVSFKMYDSDRHLLYSGVMTHGCSGFEPLDDFGAPNAGATSIKIRTKKSGRFEEL